MRWTGTVDRHLLNLSVDLGGGVASDHSCPPGADHVDVAGQITGDGRGARPGAAERVIAKAVNLRPGAAAVAALANRPGGVGVPDDVNTGGGAGADDAHAGGAVAAELVNGREGG